LPNGARGKGPWNGPLSRASAGNVVSFIFIVLLIGIIITGNAATKVFSIIALIFSILTFFSRLYPGIRSMDQAGQITPHGYSRTLGIMIVCFVVFFCIALVLYLVVS